MAVIYVGDSQFKYFRSTKPSVVRCKRGARVEDLVGDLDDLSGFRVSFYLLRLCMIRRADSSYKLIRIQVRFIYLDTTIFDYS